MISMKFVLNPYIRYFYDLALNLCFRYLHDQVFNPYIFAAPVSLAWKPCLNYNARETRRRKCPLTMIL